MSTEQMREQILNSPTVQSRGVAVIKQMLDRHDDDFIKAMYQALVEQEEEVMFS